MRVGASDWIKRARAALLATAVLAVGAGTALAETTGQSTASPAGQPSVSPSAKGSKIMSDDKRSATGEVEMTAAKALTTKVLAIGSWTAKATPETRPPIMPFEARDTLRLQLAGKIDQWFAKSDGSGAVFLMNTTDPAEAHALLEALPLGRADMMTFELIPVGPLWPLGLMLREPAK
jgi:hypothetical protein